MIKTTTQHRQLFASAEFTLGRYYQIIGAFSQVDIAARWESGTIPYWEMQLDFAIPQASRDFTSAVRKMVETQLMPHDASIEIRREIPPAAMAAIREMGLFGSHTPKQYDGLGLDMLGNCLVIAEMARAHIAYFYTYSMNVHIASKGIELHGSEEQRMRWLPRLASGEAIGSYALTEENAGSDAAGIETSVTHSDAHYVLNGSKRYITNAPIADIFTVFAAHSQSRGEKKKISAFVVERSTPGLSIGRSFPMAGGLGAHHAEIILKDAAIPEENLLGDEGDGLKIALQCLDAGRINWAAYCVGAAQHLLDMTLAHVETRRQFGKPLVENQGIQWTLADMAADVHAARLVCHEAGWRYDREPDTRSSTAAMAKLVASEMVGRVADRAMQLFGGAGYRRDMPIERIWREVRAIRILEGTSEVMRHIIARDMRRAKQHQSN